MKEKFLNYAQKISSGENIENIIKDLKDIFNKNSLYHEEGACLEKLYHITHDYKLFNEIGQIFQYKVRNRDIANAAYNKYLYYSDKTFFTNYAKNLNELGVNLISVNNMEENTPPEIQALCDKFDLIIFMMICLHKNQEYDTIMKLIPFLLKTKTNIINTFSAAKNKDYLVDAENSEKHLSDVLSSTKHRNDINKFAIDLNPSNERAYINIMDDLVSNENDKNAIEFYNNTYSRKFNKPQIDSAENLCWQISDFYKNRYEFYDAVRFQKFALERGLGAEANA